MHPDGYLEIKDRSKDVINSGGEKVCSAEVESVLYWNPGVNEAAVVAKPGGVPSEKDIMEFCRERLLHFMAPKTVVFTEELPKTSNTEVRVTRNCHVYGLSRLRLDELDFHA
ncbi:putative AMP dependent ligase [Prunus yedoensis var. nudiflora]|uniref:Putative AMP dependent ligase n=1 Tax=Prunus yedoensis var. nudiflora TaxID=2094558 RepID=A0A314XVZ3_PRUYE|nr:putative AMP dependent ligase [Prunus yedoensis var. nudiflora]